MMFTGKLTQELSHDLRTLVGLLLDLAFANGVERPEKPHLLQVADERLQVFCGFDLWKEKRVRSWKECMLSRSAGTNQTYQVGCLDLHLEL